jgi:hypothetical protein
MFIDDVWPRIKKKFPFIPREMIVAVNIQNCADYFYENCKDWPDNNNVIHVENRFPCVSPPWPITWYEWDMKKPGNTSTVLGCLLAGRNIDPEVSAEIALESFIADTKKKLIDSGRIEGEHKEALYVPSTPVKWFCGGSCYMGSKSNYPPGSIVPQIVGYCCDRNGQMPEGGYVVFDTYQLLWDLLYLGPIWMATTFLHCKNTEVIDSPPHPERLQKARIKRGKEPLFQYKTLNVGFAKKIIETTRQNKEPVFHKALHICRGHFKDFSNGRGLFGKYKGLYWWDMHARGSEKEGIIFKDYKVSVGAEVTN